MGEDGCLWSEPDNQQGCPCHSPKVPGWSPGTPTLTCPAPHCPWPATGHGARAPNLFPKQGSPQRSPVHLPGLPAPRSLSGQPSAPLSPAHLCLPTGLILPGNAQPSRPPRSPPCLHLGLSEADSGVLISPMRRELADRGGRGRRVAHTKPLPGVKPLQGHGRPGQCHLPTQHPCRWADGGPERLGALPKGTQQVAPSGFEPKPVRDKVGALWDGDRCFPCLPPCSGPWSGIFSSALSGRAGAVQ